MDRPIIARLNRPWLIGAGNYDLIYLICGCGSSDSLSSMVPGLFRGFGLGLGLMNGTSRMVGWRIDGIQLQLGGL